VSANKWTCGYQSACGRFRITRYIRRGGIEWGLDDQAVPFVMDRICRTLADARYHAEWRLANVRPQGRPLIEVL
jgi:hypothetical protein